VDFVHDVALLQESRKHEALHTTSQELEQDGQQTGLVINAEKATNAGGYGGPGESQVRGQAVQVFGEFCYHGSTVSSDFSRDGNRTESEPNEYLSYLSTKRTEPNEPELFDRPNANRTELSDRTEPELYAVGSFPISNFRHEKYVSIRLGKVSSAFGRLEEVYQCKSASVHVKMMLYVTRKSPLLHYTETWQ